MFSTLMCLGFALNAFAVDGTFQGKVVDPPDDVTVEKGWIFVQGRNHLLRKVDVSHARIVFGQNVPVDQRRKCGMECIASGQLVRVTANQDASGEWRAKEVEILRLTVRTALGPVAELTTSIYKTLPLPEKVAG